MTPAPDASTSPPWVIIGCGRLGTALTLQAERLGIEVRAAWSRSSVPDVNATRRATGDVAALGPDLDGAAVFITVVDEAISEVAAAIAPHTARAFCVVHCSGSQSSDILRSAGIAAPVASVHPLLAVAEPGDAVDRFPEVVWSVEGDPAATDWARQWLGRIDVDPVVVEPDGKTLYHASAVAAAGLLVGLMDSAFALAEGAGMSPADARRMLLPLARSALENLDGMSTSEALTGPVARGDEGVLARHRAAIGRLDDALLLEVYEVLTRRTEVLRDRNDDSADH